MKTVVIFLLLVMQVAAQHAQKAVKISKTFTNKKLTGISENDRNGNAIFTVNDGMNGPITMVFASDYDGQNRETVSYSAHSNIGYYVLEKVYDGNRILIYEYPADTTKTHSFDRDFLKTIKNKALFVASDGIQLLLARKKKLFAIDVLNADKKIETSYYVSDKGDTTDIRTYRYDAKGNEVFFHLEEYGSKIWNWDVHYNYDENSNQIKSYRVEPLNGNDTTEVRDYTYNEKNLRISERYSNHGKLENRTEYAYDKLGRMSTMQYFEPHEEKPIAVTRYKYDKKGNLLRQIHTSYRDRRDVEKKVMTFKEIYWDE